MRYFQILYHYYSNRCQIRDKTQGYENDARDFFTVIFHS